MEENMEENKGEFELITRMIKGREDIDYIYKKSKIFDIIFGSSIIVSLFVVVLSKILGWNLMIEMILIVGAILLQLSKVILDYRQYVIMVKLIAVEKEIVAVK